MESICGRLVLICISLILVGEQTAAQQAGCTPIPGSCPDGLVCTAAGVCEIPAPTPDDNQMAYIIMGVALGVVVILTIIILFVSCGRWRWGAGRNTQIHRRRNTTVVQNAPRRRRKINLKFRMKSKPFPQQYHPEGTHSVFVMGDNKAVTTPVVEPLPTHKSNVGPHVANIDLDGSVVTGYNISNVNLNHSQSQPQPQPQPVVVQQTAAPAPAPPGCTRVDCTNMHQSCCSDMHHHHHHGYPEVPRPAPTCQNIDVHAVIPAPIYPQLAEVSLLRPQMQMQMQAPMPTAAVHAQHMHQHAGIYPQIGHAHNHHAQVHQPQPGVSGPPSYETTQRKM